jgi:serine kinase of HPr protein (carbohydrate metabolism regulator)
MLIHASCVAIEGAGVLLRGPSGSGKSDLALRLVDSGAQLVADDQVDLFADSGSLVARAPAALAGLLEVRGIGIVECPAIEAALVALVVDLVPHRAVERVPEPDYQNLVGVPVRRIALDPFEPSAAAKVRLAVRGAVRRA